MLLSVTLDLLSVFFSDQQFSMLIAFFESDVPSLSFDVSIYRVCSVPAISRSLFSNGSQIACDHS